MSKNNNKRYKHGEDSDVSVISGRGMCLDNLIRVKDVITERTVSELMEQIVREVANYYELEPEVIMSGSNNEYYEHARKVAVYLCSKLTQASYGNIAKMFRLSAGGDVMRKCAIIEAELPVVESLRKDVNAIIEAVRQSKTREHGMNDDEREMILCYRSLSNTAKAEFRGFLRGLRQSKAGN